MLLVVYLLLLVSFFGGGLIRSLMDAGMLFSFCIILFIESVKILIQYHFQ